MYVYKTQIVMQTKVGEVCCYVDKTKKGMLTKLRQVCRQN